MTCHTLNDWRQLHKIVTGLAASHVYGVHKDNQGTLDAINFDEQRGMVPEMVASLLLRSGLRSIVLCFLFSVRQVLVVGMARPQANKPAKPGPRKPGQAGPFRPGLLRISSVSVLCWYRLLYGICK